MVQADKIKILLDLQCKIAAWLEKFNKALSLGQCVDSYSENAVVITNLMKVLYRYQAFNEAVTNLDKITFDYTENSELETYTISIDYGATNLVTLSSTGPLDAMIQEIVTQINQDSETTGYYCISENNIVYLYTYDVLAVYSDIPTITITESDNLISNLGATVESLTSDDTYLILDNLNCLTLEEFCTIVCKIKTLLTDCNCG